MSATRQYACDYCGGIFTTDEPVEAVLAETREVFGCVPAEDARRSLCDTCYKKFRAWLDSLSPVRRAEIDHVAQAQQPMQAKDLIPFDPAGVPWTTTPDDWALCLVPTQERRIWIEHHLIRAVLEAQDRDPDSVANIHGVFTTIGDKVAAVINQPDFALSANQVREVQFTGSPVAMRVGRFGGDLFVFMPRPELEP
jgi:hypothetical protein